MYCLLLLYSYPCFIIVVWVPYCCTYEQYEYLETIHVLQSGVTILWKRVLQNFIFRPIHLLFCAPLGPRGYTLMTMRITDISLPTFPIMQEVNFSFCINVHPSRIEILFTLYYTGTYALLLCFVINVLTCKLCTLVSTTWSFNLFVLFSITITLWLCHLRQMNLEANFEK